jgi:hypothetical protein
MGGMVSGKYGRSEGGVGVPKPGKVLSIVAPELGVCGMGLPNCMAEGCEGMGNCEGMIGCEGMGG